MTTRPKRCVHSEDTAPAQSVKHPRRSLRTNAATKTPPEFCYDCQQIDLPDAFTNADKYFEANWDLTLGLREWRSREGLDTFIGLLVAGLGQRISQPDRSCRLCSFLWDARIKHHGSSDSNMRYELRAFPCYWALPFMKINAKTFQRKHRQNQSSVLAVIPSSLTSPSLLRRELVRSAIFRTSSMVPGHVTAKPVAPFADFESIKEWMAFCCKHHGNGCVKTRQKEDNQQPFRSPASG